MPTILIVDHDTALRSAIVTRLANLGQQPPEVADGSDQNRVGAWPEKGILDTQLGPNRNGRTW